MNPSLLDAFDLVAHSEQLLLRLEAAAVGLSKKQGLADEKAWLDQAVKRVKSARDGIGDLLTRVLRLPEMDPVREDHARRLQNEAVDMVEKLHAGITFAGGSRAPLLEALYGKLKKADEDEILGKMKVSALLEALPKVGKVKAQEIMKELEIAPTRRLRGLGERQRRALLERFGFDPEK